MVSVPVQRRLSGQGSEARVEVLATVLVDRDNPDRPIDQSPEDHLGGLLGSVLVPVGLFVIAVNTENHKVPACELCIHTEQH